MKKKDRNKVVCASCSKSYSQQWDRKMSYNQLVGNKLLTPEIRKHALQTMLGEFSLAACFLLEEAYQSTEEVLECWKVLAAMNLKGRTSIPALNKPEIRQAMVKWLCGPQEPYLQQVRTNFIMGDNATQGEITPIVEAMIAEEWHDTVIMIQNESGKIPQELVDIAESKIVARKLIKGY